jgi:hypothetical protein
MLQSPGEERQRLTEEYARKYDGELEQLAESSSDLTEIARDVLREEMRKRGLDRAGAKPAVMDRPAEVGIEDQTWDLAFTSAPPAGSSGAGADDDNAHDYTWKTYLCECETQEQARQLAEALRRAKIDCWIRGLRGTYPQVMVAADQLEQARSIANQPIPQAVIDELKAAEENPQAFEMPVCPNCGAQDPLLLAAGDDGNIWLCEACDEEWTDTHGSIAPEAGAD